MAGPTREVRARRLSVEENPQGAAQLDRPIRCFTKVLALMADGSSCQLVTSEVPKYSLLVARALVRSLGSAMAARTRRALRAATGLVGSG